MKSMKKVLAGFLMVLALVLMVPGNVPARVQAASKKSTYQTAVKYYKNGKFSKAQKYFKKLPKKASESCVKKMPSGMKKAYKKLVQKYSKNNNRAFLSSKPYMWAYYLTDIDKDKKADLIIKYGSCEADARVLVFSYKNGKAKHMGTYAAGHTSFYQYPYGKGVLVLWAHMGYEEIYLLQIDKMKSVTLNERTVNYYKGENYVIPAYELDSHISYDKNYKATVDYKPFR